MENAVSKKNWYYRPLLVVDMIAVLIAAGLNVYMLFWTSAQMFTKFFAVVSVCVLAFSFLYVMRNASKAAANDFKALLLLCAVAEFFGIVSHIELFSLGAKLLIPVVVSSGVVVVLYFIMAQGKDLGKGLSLFLCFFAFAVQILILALDAGMKLDAGAEPIVILIRDISVLVIASVVCISTIAKYADKAARGSE